MKTEVSKETTPPKLFPWSTRKRPNTNDQRKWRQVQKPRKTGPQKRHHDDSREQKEHIPFKKQRLTTEELENTIKDKIQKSKESIAKLKNHIESNTCPKTLRYNARATLPRTKNSNET